MILDTIIQSKSERGQREMTEVLHDLVVTVNSTLDIDQVLDIAVHRLQALHQATACSVSFLNDTGKYFIFRATTDPGIDISQGITFPAANSIAGRAIRECKVQIVNDVDVSPDHRAEIARRTGIVSRSLLTAPLFAGDEPLGVIQIVSGVPNAFTQADADLLATAAALIESAIARAQTYDRAVRLAESERRQREMAESLQEVATALNASLELNPDEVLNRTLNRLRKVVPYDSASVMLMEDGLLRLKVGHGFPPECQPCFSSFVVGEDSLSYEIYRQPKPLIVPDADQEPRWFITQGTEYIRCWLGVPLVVRDRSIGVLNLDHHP